MKLQMGNLTNNAAMRQVCRHPWLAGATGGGVFIVLASLALFLPQLYSASTTLVVTSPENFSLGSANREALSNANLENLIKEFELNDEYASGSVGGSLDRVRQAISVDFSQGGDETRKSFVISFHGADARKTMDMTNALAALYIGRNSIVHHSNASESSQVSQALNEEQTHIRGQIEEQKRQILQYKDRYRRELPDQLDANRQTVASLQSQMAGLTGDLKRKRNQRIALANKATLDDAVKPKNTDATLSALISYVASLRQELAELRTLYADEHPAVQRARQELESLEARIQFRSKRAKQSKRAEQLRVGDGDRQVSMSLAELDAEITRIETKRRKLEQQLEDYQQYIADTPKREQELQTLILASQKLEEQYASNLGHAPTSEVKEGEAVRVLHPATSTSTTGPGGSRRFFSFLGALVFGIGAAFGSVFLWEKFIDTSFHSETELEAETHFPVLVTIPRIL